LEGLSLPVTNKKTERRKITDGKTGADKNIIEKIETTDTTDDKIGGDKPSNEKTETT
jgi:hypothetical protein